ncbi:FapA family protein [bacterium]|nr:FapA family protein [bacterium]
MDIEKIDFAVGVSDDRLEVTLDCTVPDSGADGLIDQIQSRMKALKIAIPIDRDALNQKIAGARANGGRIAGEVLVRGVPPVPPQDSVLEWTRDFFGSAFVVDPVTGNIDYRRRSGQPAVESGELLARLIPLREGKPGTDVFGKRIPVGRPCQPRVHLGLNVRDEKKDGIHHYYAAAAGRVRWVSDVLAVDDVLTISGDVGLETGHVKHQGALIIKGDVLAGSRIEAGGDIEIHGSVEPSDIQTGGNLHVDQGITGAKGRKISVGGSLQAKYLMEVDAQAGGDIIVESEIIHSTLKARGRVCMPGGRLIGGDVAAEKGMDLGEAGNALCAPTRLAIGEDTRRAKDETPKQETPEEARLNQVRKEFEAYSAKPTLTAQDREKMTELQFEEWELANKIEASVQEEIEIANATPKAPPPRIVVRTKLYPEAKICCANAKVTISEEMPGPLFALFFNDRLRLHKLEEIQHPTAAVA